MKKVEIETECGETSIIYISQDIKKITVDDEKYSPTEPEETDDRLPTKNHSDLKPLLERMLEVMDEADSNHWRIHYKVDDKRFEFDWEGYSLPRKIFQID